ncbi:hypothetical protein BC941DRAFT_477271 [Chlamydoabsidia padenii]|nr:hypothetical protein BC941DRAFT_477271 [Chlamydoabsidia padenii]
MHFSFIPSIDPPPPQQRHLWKMARLNEEHYYDLYRDGFSKIINTLATTLAHHHDHHQPSDDHQAMIEKWKSDLCSHIYHALDNSVGRRQQQSPDRHHIFWMNEMTKATDQREHLYTKWRRAYGHNKISYWIQRTRWRITFKDYTREDSSTATRPPLTSTTPSRPQKAPGIDSITTEMLLPLSDQHFRKLIEKCLQNTLMISSPPLDMAQGGFHSQHSAMDQAICLA